MRIIYIFFLYSIIILNTTVSYAQSTEELKQLCDEALKYRYSDMSKSLQLIAKVEEMTKSNAEKDTFYAEALRIKGNIIKGNSPDSALYFLRKSRNIFKKGNSIRGEVRTLVNIALIQTSLGNYDTSHKIYNTVDLLAKQLKNEGLELQNLINWVQNFYSNQDYKNAIKYNDRARDLNAKLGNKFNAYIYSNYAKIHMELRNFETALEFYLTARKYLKFDRNLIPVFHSISNCYHSLGKMDKALLYIDSLKQFELDSDDLIRIHDQLINIAIKNKDREKFNANIRVYDSLYTILQEAQFHCMTLHYQAIFEHETNNIKNFREKAYLAFDCLQSKKINDLAADMAKRIVSVNLNERNNKILDFLTTYQDSVRKEGIYRVINQSELNLFNEINEIENEKEKHSLELMELEKKYANKELNRKSKLNSFLIIFLSLMSAALIYILYLMRLLRKNNKTLQIQKDKISILHHELNHRVKNNLAFMTSLVEMQGRRTKNIEAREILQETENRLSALSLVHSNLFKNNDATTVNLAAYIEELITQLEKIFTIPGKYLNISCDLTDHHVNADDAMRLGLIVNELITNSVKHAFDQIEEPLIKISTTVDNDGKLILEYKDNGPGHDHISNFQTKEKNDNLGTKLISLLREQIKDRYTVIC